MCLRKLVVKTSVFLLFFNLFNCSTANYKVNKNEKRTTKISNEIFKKNKNVFVISYSFANFSYIFSYRDTITVEWYKIVNGKINNVKQIKTDYNFFLNKPDSLSLSDFFECEAYDHSYLNLKFYSNEELIDHTFSIDPNCFVDSKSRNIFLKNIKKDIQNYKKIDNSLYH